MRCQDCNTNLTDEESVKKDAKTGQYLDICNKCLSNFYKDIDDLYMDSTNGDDLYMDYTLLADYPGEDYNGS